MNLSVGLKVVILNEDNEILIIKRDKVEALSEKWDLPGGRIESNEPLRDALSRELREEIGVELEKVVRPLAITAFL